MKIVRLAPMVDSEYAGDPEFGEPKSVRHALPPPAGGYIDETIYVVKPGKDYSVSDGHAEYLQQTWGWRVVVRDKP